jgi:hypothetical protein
MPNFSMFVRAIASGGYLWKVMANGKTVRSRTKPTEFEARVMADSEIKELEQNRS